MPASSASLVAVHIIHFFPIVSSASRAIWFIICLAFIAFVLLHAKPIGRILSMFIAAVNSFLASGSFCIRSFRDSIVFSVHPSHFAQSISQAALFHAFPSNSPVFFPSNSEVEVVPARLSFFGRIRLIILAQAFMKASQTNLPAPLAIATHSFIAPPSFML